MATPTTPAGTVVGKPAFEGGLGKFKFSSLLGWLVAIIVVGWAFSNWEPWTTPGTWFEAGDGHIETFTIPAGNSFQMIVKTRKKTSDRVAEQARDQLLCRTIQWDGKMGPWVPMKGFYVEFPRGRGGKVQVTMTKGPIKEAGVENILGPAY